MTQTASGYDLRENEFYETEPWGTDVLFRVFNLHGCCFWEPAAGNHAIADRARTKHACTVFTSDVCFYESMHDARFDFFSGDPPPTNLPNIITNPPYGRQNRLAAKFARLALQRCQGFVALLLSAGFDSGSTRVDLIRDNPRFVGKIVLLDRLILVPGTDKPGTSDHAWFVWGPAGSVEYPRLWYERKEVV